MYYPSIVYYHFRGLNSPQDIMSVASLSRTSLHQVPENELTQLFSGLKIYRSDIRNGGEVYELVKRYLPGDVARAIDVTHWILKNWGDVYKGLKKGVQAMLEFIKGLWRGAVNAVVGGFWQWLCSLTLGLIL